MQIYDGNKTALLLDSKLKAAITKKVDLNLTIIKVGDDPVSDKYIKLKTNLCEKLGIPTNYVHIDSQEKPKVIIEKVRSIAVAELCGGVIVQLPLPLMVMKNVLNTIPNEKDLDLLSDISRKKFFNNSSFLIPPVVLALDKYISDCSISLDGLKCVVVGNGFLVGSVVSHYLKSKNADVEIIEDNYDGKSKLDCLLCITGCGIPNLIRGENLPYGCNVVDFGSTFVGGKIVGDFDLTSQTDHLGCISPSPGGMGPLVVRYLIFNFVKVMSERLSLNLSDILH